jgi:hypothetical protein
LANDDDVNTVREKIRYHKENIEVLLFGAGKEVCLEVN